MSAVNDMFFNQINNDSLTELINQANESVILASPGIQKNIADVLVDAANRLGKEMVIICLDVSEHAIRLGYGDIKAVESLNAYGLFIQHVDHLRFALIVIDGKGFSFTPNALYLESDSASNLGFNAIKLTADQVQEATVRLSPAAKSLAVAQCTDEKTKQVLTKISPVIDQIPVSEASIEQIAKSLKEAPPIAFDVSRQVRIYNAYLQYVEVSMTGAALQRQKVSIPKVLQNIGTADNELEGRLKTSFDLLEKDNKLSSKKLELQLKELRDAFTPSLGKRHGRVMLKSNKDMFNTKIQTFKGELEQHANEVKSSLQKNIDESIDKISQYYLPIVLNNPPIQMLGKLGMFKDDPTQVLGWIKRQLEEIFPTAARMISKMEVSVIYKDITFENLNDDDFLVAVQNAFPDVNWDKAHQEYLAAFEKS